VPKKKSKKSQEIDQLEKKIFLTQMNHINEVAAFGC